MIDIRAILYELGIDFKTSGKNVAPNDINIDCPYCGSDKHLGINVNAGLVNCWVCEFSDFEKRPGLVRVLLDTTGEDYPTIKKILEDGGWDSNYVYSEKPRIRPNKCFLPPEAQDFSEKSHGRENALHFLRSRDFGMDIVKKYKLMYSEYGQYSGRIIIPIIMGGEVVTFTARDYTGYKNKDRYKNASIFSSKMRIKDSLYNYDIARNFNKVYLLEGPTDVWRFGDNSVAIFKSKLSASQRGLIISMGLKAISIVFDYLAIERAYEAADNLSPFIHSIKIVRLSDKRDVADRSRREILKLDSETEEYRG